MKKFIIQSVALIFVIFASLIYSTHKIPLPFVNQPLQTKQLLIKNLVINVEIAETQEQKNMGLSGRDSLASNSGMLFVFQQPNQTAFWMKGMKFALDFIYLRNNKVVDLIKNAPPPLPNETDQQLPLYLPDQMVDMVLEVNAGFIDQNNIQVGDAIQLK